ncbi:MAG TPA: hypothetical protein PL127_03980, partial [Sedimentibacter sp.]|nr:hypothetical protein [Sedimentibacter sp.]
KLYKEYEEKLSEIEKQIANSQRVIEAPVEKAAYVNIGPVRRMNIVINGVNYVVDVQEIQ